MITVWPNARPMGWDGGLARGRYLDTYGRPAPVFPVLPLRAALETPWTTDAHFTPYALAFDGEPGPTPRCNLAATDAIAGLGGALLFSCVVLDCDDRDMHGTGEPARLEWLRDWWRRSRFPFPVTAYETRGGGRIIAELREPVDGVTYLRLLAGMHAFASDRGLVPDRLIDLQRCYRLPFVVRDGATAFRPLIHARRPLNVTEQAALAIRGAMEPLADETPRRMTAPKVLAPPVGVKMKPGEYLDRHVPWSALLEPAGGRFGGMMRSQEIWYRPGKGAGFHGPPSALTNYAGGGRLKVLTTNWHPFEHGASLDKLGALAVLEGVTVGQAVRIAGERWSDRG